MLSKMLLSNCLITVYNRSGALLKHVLPIQTWGFLIGLKFVNMSFLVFRKLSENDLCKLKGLQVWSTVHVDLDKACKVGTMS